MRIPRPEPSSASQSASPANSVDMPSTHWSVIFAAAGVGDEARAAQGKLYSLYWAPIYRFILRRESNPADAQEAAQQIFANVLARRELENLHPSLGSFRGWLYKCTRNALLNRYRYRKSRPSLAHECFDDGELEDCLGSDPEREFMHHCAVALYLHARATTRRQLQRVPDVVFDAAVPEPGRPINEQADLARALGISEAAFRTRVKEVRIKFRACLYRELLQAAGSTSNLAEEVRTLCDAIAEPERGVDFSQVFVKRV